MPAPRISVAISSYDRHGPLLEGAVMHEGFDFQFEQVSESGVGGRHARFLKNLEWNAAEVSFSSFLIAVDRGLPVRAVPVFPRRLFSQSQMYKNKNSGINRPTDLRGKRVALSSYQTTLSVLAKGDLAHYYDVPWKEITFVTARAETMDVLLPAGVRVEQADSAEQLEHELIAGRIHAQFTPSPPKAFLEGNPSIGRLFDDPRVEEERHLREPGYFPIMHVVAFQQELAAQHPELPQALFDSFEKSREQARRRWNDPNWSLLLWGKHEMERQISLSERDPWANGLEANRRNIEDFVRYSYEQGLISQAKTPEELFAPIK